MLKRGLSTEKSQNPEKKRITRKEKGDQPSLPPQKGGNNQYGALGTRKCYYCRLKKFGCVYDKEDPLSVCDKCQASELECGEKLSAKDFRDRIREEREREAERDAQRLDTSQCSPRSKDVLDTILNIARQVLGGENLVKVDVLRRVASELEAYANELDPQPPRPPALQPTLGMSLDPNVQQPSLPESFEIQGFPQAPGPGGRFPLPHMGQTQIPVNSQWLPQQFQMQTTAGLQPRFVPTATVTGGPDWQWTWTQQQGNVGVRSSHEMEEEESEDYNL